VASTVAEEQGKVEGKEMGGARGGGEDGERRERKRLFKDALLPLRRERKCAGSPVNQLSGWLLGSTNV